METMQKFALSNKERGKTKLDLGDVDVGILECQGSIVGKVQGDKVVNYTGIKNFVTLAWSFPKDLRVTELGPNIF